MASILYVEDDSSEADIFERFIETSGWKGKYMWADNAERGLEILAKEGPPSLVVTDIRMPALDGFGFVHELRKMPEMFGVPIFFYTSSMDDEDRLRAYAIGCTGYMIKPQTVDDLERHTRLFTDFADIVRAP